MSDRDETLARLLRGCRDGCDMAAKLLASTSSDMATRAKAHGIMQAQVTMIDSVLSPDKPQQEAPKRPAVS